MLARRPVLVVLGILSILLGLLLLLPALVVARSEAPGVPAGVNAAVNVLFVFALSILPIGLGVALVLMGTRELPAQTFAALRAWPGRLASAVAPARLLRALGHPFGLLALAWLIGVVPVAVGGELGSIVSALGLTALCVAQPMVSAFRPRWWLHTALSLVGWALLFVTLGLLPQVTALRESAMIYILPLMVYPAALALSGVVRAFLWLRHRQGAADAEGAN